MTYKHPLKLPDAAFTLSDLEKLNADMTPSDLKLQFCEVLAQGKVEVVRKYNGEAVTPMTYRKRQ